MAEKNVKWTNGFSSLQHLYCIGIWFGTEKSQNIFPLVQSLSKNIYRGNSLLNEHRPLKAIKIDIVTAQQQPQPQQQNNHNCSWVETK